MIGFATAVFGVIAGSVAAWLIDLMQHMSFRTKCLWHCAVTYFRFEKHIPPGARER